MKAAATIVLFAIGAAAGSFVLSNLTARHKIGQEQHKELALVAALLGAAGGIVVARSRK